MYAFIQTYLDTETCSSRTRASWLCAGGTFLDPAALRHHLGRLYMAPCLSNLVPTSTRHRLPGPYNTIGGSWSWLWNIHHYHAVHIDLQMAISGSFDWWICKIMQRYTGHISVCVTSLSIRKSPPEFKTFISDSWVNFLNHPVNVSKFAQSHL